VNDTRGMRVLLVIESAGGGSGRHVLDLAVGLLSADIEVTLIYSPVRADSWFAREADAVDGLKIHKMEIHRALGLGDFLAAIKLRRFMATHGPFDIVHGHSAKAGAIVRLAGVGTRAIRVYTAHAFVTLDPELGGLPRKIYNSAERLLALLGSAVICVSQEEREHAIQAGIPGKDRIFVVDNGLGALPAPDRAAVRRGWMLKEGDVCLGFVGRISRQKAVHRLVEVFSKLYERYSNLYLVIVGEGPLLDTVKELAEHLGVAERVIFHGSGNGPALMAGFDLFTLTSRYEAFPYVYLEALSRGLPIVTTRVGGSGAVVREGINGHVVDHNDQERFVELVGELCGDPQRREEMGRASQRLASQFTVDNMVAQTVKVYRWLLRR
jgi:glycosyltransferase involved in cell wall biosynthesis